MTRRACLLRRPSGLEAKRVTQRGRRDRDLISPGRCGHGYDGGKEKSPSARPQDGSASAACLASGDGRRQTTGPGAAFHERGGMPSASASASATPCSAGHQLHCRFPALYSSLTGKEPERVLLLPSFFRENPVVVVQSYNIFSLLFKIIEFFPVPIYFTILISSLPLPWFR